MVKLITLMMCVLLTGCVHVVQEDNSPLSNEPVAIKKDVAKGLTNIDQVRVGMLYDEVSQLMGSSVNIGFKQNPNKPEGFEPITMKNPYRVEILTQNKKTYNVFYYFTHLVKTDGMVSDDELTPLVFDNDKLIGKGWDFLFKLKNP